MRKPNRPMTQEERDFIARNAPRLGHRATAEAFERRFGKPKSAGSVKCWCHRHGIYVANPMNAKVLTDEQEAWVHANAGSWSDYDEAYKAFTAEFGCNVVTRTQLAAWMRRHGHTIGIDVRWRPGESYRGSDRALGDETVVGGSVLVKVAERAEPGTDRHSNWVPKSHLVWEAEHGRKWPEGALARFMNGDNRDFSPGNVIALDKGDAAIMHSIGMRFCDAKTLEIALLVAKMVKEAKRLREAAGISYYEMQKCGVGYSFAGRRNDG